MKTPWPGEIWVLTFSQGMPETKALFVRVTDVGPDLIWFTYIEQTVPQILATPTSIFPTLYTYVRGAACKTNRKKSFFSKIGSLWRRFFSTNARDS